ncbi:uncharacterized protein VTP21DRAFT_9035 [Calcarisporiella thermophila]|uniref:uncharacterized protein n=1 Tax=Calcarisporiella thermophila TaxID=911321 RepID=UPI0037428DF2
MLFRYRNTKLVCSCRLYSVPAVDTWRKSILSRTLTEVDTVTSSPVDLFSLTLDRPSPTKTPEKILPPNWHLLFFPPRLKESELAPDGYDTIYSPPPPYIQRMWAGGSVEFNTQNPLRVGDELTQKTQCTDVELKKGGGNKEMCFVWLEKVLENKQGWSVRDRRCFVYLPRADENKKTTRRNVILKKIPDFERTWIPSPILLFRYSALTFNSHLIHYDHDYSTHIEHHPERLVHGPLTATLLLELIGENTKKKVKNFKYRAVSPFYVNEKLRVCGKESGQGEFEVWAENAEGGVGMTGSVEVE